MGRRSEAHATGAIIGRHQSWGGPTISVAITLSERAWDKLTRAYADLWREAEDDLEVRELTLEERIALFVTDAADRWCERGRRAQFDNDLDDDVPF